MRIVLAVVFAIATHGAGAFAASTTHQVLIQGMKFSPETLSVKPGDTVVWVNKDAFPHDATAASGAFKSKQIAPDGSWKYKATKKGTFAYICTIHPTMKAP